MTDDMADRDVYYSLDQVNAMDFHQFRDVFGNVIENCNFCAAAVWSFRPFDDVKHLHTTFSRFLDELPLAGKEGVLRGFPDLAVRASQVKHLTPESASEQRLAGLLDVTDEERHKMTQLNRLYKQKFGFPFVICARQNRKEAILKGLDSRISHSFQQELERALEQAKEICYLRLLDLVHSNGNHL